MALQFSAVAVAEDEGEYGYLQQARQSSLLIAGFKVVSDYEEALASLIRLHAHSPLPIVEARPFDIDGVHLHFNCGRCTTWFQIVMLDSVTQACPLCAIQQTLQADVDNNSSSGGSMGQLKQV